MLKRITPINKSKKGFTIIELLITVAVLGILSTVSLAILWSAITAHNTLSSVSINSQVSVNTMEYIHQGARVATSVKVENSVVGDKITYLNTSYNTAKEDSIAIFESATNELKLAIKDATGWKEFTNFDKGIDKAEFETSTTPLSGAGGIDNVKLTYKFYSEKNVIYEAGVQMENVSAIGNANTNGVVTFDLLDGAQDVKVLIIQ